MVGQGASPRLLVLVGLALFIGIVHAQERRKGKTKCCDAKLMDSAGYVMIEGHQPLPPMTRVRGVKATLCVEEMSLLHIGVWRKNPMTTGNNSQYALHWSMILDVKEDWISPFTNTWTRDLVDGGITFEIGPNDYLGFWAPESYRVPVPFDFDASNDTYTFYLSDRRYTNVNELDSLLTHADFVRWPRTFKGWFTFCEEHDCSDQDGNGQGQQIVGPVGPPGPPGPPGAPGSNVLIGFDDILNDLGEVQCAVPEVAAKVDDAQLTIQALSNQINQMQQALNAIYNSQSITGICPTGMIPGTYGVGSCYVIQLGIVPMAVAELRCRSDFDAHLVSIESEFEERFIRNEILKLLGNRTTDANVPKEFWTSAMFNKADRRWIWYHEARYSQPVVQYTNWKGRFAPTPQTDDDVCSTFNVNPLTTVSEWNLLDCNKYRPYICEVSKKCL